MTILPREKTKCGYSKKFLLKSPSIQSNLAKILPKSTINGQPVNTVAYDDFFKKSINMPSQYNSVKMATVMTQLSETKFAALANMTFGNKTVQFIAVDGSKLTQYQFENPDTVIDMVNRGTLPPIVVDSTKMTAFEKTNLDAYSGSVWYGLMLWDVFDRVGIIDDSHVYLSVVGVPMANAFWNSHYMTYGNGNEPGAPKMSPLTSIDVVGHESGHGIIEALGNLEYQGESGALNESIADILGVCLEKYFDLKTGNTLFDWTMGEDFIPGGLRSIENPKLKGQPDLYQGKNWANTRSQEDEGGVHTNSGVNNYLFYCLATGKDGRNEKGKDYVIDGVFEMFHLARFIYISLKGSDRYEKIHSTATYPEYCDILTNNCDRYLQDHSLSSDLLTSLNEGFVAVGLKTRTTLPVPPTPTPPVPPKPTPPVPVPPKPTPVPPCPYPCPYPQPYPNPYPRWPYPIPQYPPLPRWPWDWF